MRAKGEGIVPARGDPLRHDYRRFRALDGSHPFRARVPGGYVDYPARRRRGGRIVYFHFALAREMGLLPSDHPDRLTPGLRRAILDTFCLQIVNEWDEIHGTPIPARDRLPGRYMATRYLQMQHPDRRGGSSGDGRSVWNGCVTHAGVTWDVSSQGTGVTRLCPATATERRFFKSGNRHASYGCGTAALAEGLGAAIMSEVFHRNGIATERVLAVIALPDGYAINVRAARNLLRPSHFFTHSKRRRLEALRGLADLFVERQIANGDWPRAPAGRRFHLLAEQAAQGFARTVAIFESEYVFCWLDWDGDNVLADGAIVDYGSVRQFGLYHREYRFDDGPRWSTTLPQQRIKARHLVQNFAQIRDALESGRIRPLARFRRDPAVLLFDRTLEEERERLLLARLGFDPERAEALRSGAASELRRLARSVAWFERARSSRGPVKVPDGLTWNAVYCVRDLLRELPARFAREPRWLAAEELFGIACSSYASRRDRALTPHRRRRARELQRAYLALAVRAAEIEGTSVPAVLAELARRSATINRQGRITGDSVDFVTARLLRMRRRLGPEALYTLVRRFVDAQDRRPPPPSAWDRVVPPRPRDALRAPLARLLGLVAAHREGL